MNEKNLVIIDDHKMISEGVSSFLARTSDWKVAFSSQSEAETLSILDEKYGEDYKFKNSELLALVDLKLGEETSFELISKLTKRGIKCIVYSMYDSPSFILRAMENGADGYLIKEEDENEILKALDCVWNGEQYFSATQLQSVSRTVKVVHLFTKREKEVFELSLEGLSVLEIAKKMKLSHRTVENYFSQIFEKTGCTSKDELREMYGSSKRKADIYGGGVQITSGFSET